MALPESDTKLKPDDSGLLITSSNETSLVNIMKGMSSPPPHPQNNQGSKTKRNNESNNKNKNKDKNNKKSGSKNMQAVGQIINQMEMVYLHGLMEESMMENM